MGKLQIFLIQVCQSKLTILKIMSRKIFGEFSETFLKGLNPFKTQTQFQVLFLPIFFNSNSVGNFNSFEKVKSFLSKLSSTLQSMKMFRAQEGLILYFSNQNNFVY
jgi:hypothetical protein